MPNWCENRVTMKFEDKAEYAEFVDRLIQKENLDEFEDENKMFETFVPTPEGLSDDWYEWRVENWGTKWNPTIFSMSMEDELKTIVMSMDTAWSPPIGFFSKLTELFPSLSIVLHYVEEAMAFMGTAWISNGDVTENSFDITREVLIKAGAQTTEEGEIDYEFDYDLFGLLEEELV
jgi:hypothetical protein